MLTLPDFSHPLVFETDAWGTGIGEFSTNRDIP